MSYDIADEVWKMWSLEFPDLRQKKSPFKIRETLKDLDLLPIQFRYLMQEYKKESPYPNIGNFVDWCKPMILGDFVPEEVICRGYLSDDLRLNKAAELIEVIESAWFPTVESERKVVVLKKMIMAGVS